MKTFDFIQMMISHNLKGPHPKALPACRRAGNPTASLPFLLLRHSLLGRGASFLGLRLYLLGFLNKIDKGLDPCFGGRSQEALHFVNGEMILQKLYDIRPELPARDDSSAWKGIVDGTTVSEWNLTPELRTVNHQ